MIYKLIYFAMCVALLLTMVIEPLIIPWMHRLKFGQSIRKEGPQSHQSKSGTPTMGGIVFSLIPFVTVLLYFLLINRGSISFHLENWVLLFVPLFGYALIGFIDDYLIVVRKSNDGLSVRLKFLLQILIAALFFAIYIVQGYSTDVKLTASIHFDLKWFYGILIFFMLVGGTNAVNLTDGLDGLAAGLVAFTVSTFTFVAFINQQYDVVLFGAALLGSVLGFLVFNSHPAKIFMGDTGSLALGAAIASMAILTKYELLLVVAGGVYVLETLSDVLQVAYFKKTKGKRLFKMAPLHHHFELSGMKESSVVFLFYSMGFVFSLISILIVILST